MSPALEILLGLTVLALTAFLAIKEFKDRSSEDYNGADGFTSLVRFRGNAFFLGALIFGIWLVLSGLGIVE